MAIEIQTETWYLLWAIVIAVIVGLAIAVLKLQQKYKDAIGQLKERGKQSRQLGINEIKGGINQILGTFSLLNEYEEIMLLATTSGNASMDLIGVNQNSLDFIEIKTKGSPLTKGEKKVRRLIQEKMVNYRIVDADLPVDFKIEERTTQNNQQ
ncbi:hypothetical protein [Candidatus Nitrosotenuis cloacae]|uniref:Holliday junction resolvase-related domain-containing protein n=1 Tax=Candidatus Nitrosotenuis cloacae TaxID=1603555 RepID=A0A3G1B5A8_9ARCH|nr:hypothetical protein [Candidatus Nitrosotenuis cloacae]AJZ76189.1 hypothetical protein SU86_007230 [Candidatus Nitrosotenuis cloacae]